MPKTLPAMTPLQVFAAVNMAIAPVKVFELALGRACVFELALGRACVFELALGRACVFASSVIQFVNNHPESDTS